VFQFIAGLPPRLSIGLPILDSKGGPSGANGRGYTPSQHSSPFGNSRGGPSVEIFKSRFADGNNGGNTTARAGYAGSTKRSMSGTLLPNFPNTLRANSVSPVSICTGYRGAAIPSHMKCEMSVPEMNPLRWFAR